MKSEAKQAIVSTDTNSSLNRRVFFKLAGLSAIAFSVMPVLQSGKLNAANYNSTAKSLYTSDKIAYIFGHKIPDSDSICAAISLAYLKNQIGEKTIPARQGDINEETRFILTKFDVEIPMFKTEYAKERVYLVDHSDLSQSPADLKEATILGIVDHHKLGGIATSAPLECWIRPVGCTNTIIKEMFAYYNVAIPKKIAGCMLGAILSDTVIFKSPTTTKLDIKACEELALIAGVSDIKAFGVELFMVKSQLDGLTAEKLILKDYKKMVMGDKKVGIGQLEIVDLKIFDTMKGNLLDAMKTVKEDNGLHTIVLLLTDIMTEGSQMLVVSDDTNTVEKAFNIKLANSQVWMPGVMSRKKQVVPVLSKAFE